MKICFAVEKDGRYASMAPTIAQNITLFKEGKLPVLTLQHSCAGHQGGEGCGHH
jgi:hypothetical protein